MVLKFTDAEAADFGNVTSCLPQWWPYRVSCALHATFSILQVPASLLGFAALGQN